MKNRIICVLLIISMLVVSFGAQGIKIKKNRYHQHMEAMEKTACTDHGEEKFCTHLPLLNITTDDPMPDPFYWDENGNVVMTAEGSRVHNDTMVGATVEYFDNNAENNHLDDVPTVSERALIRNRGASSREFDKKGYLLKFKKEDMISGKKVSLSGMTPDSEWVLHGPFLDKTLIRNYLCYNLAGEIMDYSPNVRFCEAFLNGEYIGVYLIVEKIERNDNGRIDIEKSNVDMATTSYIVKIDRRPEDLTESVETFSQYSYMAVNRGENRGYYEIVYPGLKLTEEQKEYIKRDISKFEKTLYSFAYNDNEYGYKEYIDVDSFVDYFLINEFTLNYDAMGLSTYLYRDIGDKMKLCVWDFNSAFDLYEESLVRPETFSLQNSMWYSYLFKDKDFVDCVVKRYFELRDTFFDEEYMMNYIDETIAYLGPAIDRNYEKWGYSFNSEYNGVVYDRLYPEERNPRSYEEAVEQLKTCIQNRIVHMDSHIERLYTLCHDSLNKSYNYTKEKK